LRILPTIRGHGEEGAPNPGDRSACGWNADEGAAVHPCEPHPSRCALFGGDEVLDDAAVVAERGVDRAHVLDEAIHAPARRAERSAKAQRRVEDFASYLLIGVIPHLGVKAFDERFRVGLNHVRSAK